MKVTFLGVGDAVDEYCANTSVLIEDKINILLDCGYSVPQKLWQYNNDPNFLDAIYISHNHADHSFGLPAILLRMFEDKRKKQLKIIVHKSIDEDIKDVIKFGFKHLLPMLSYKLEFLNFDNKSLIPLKNLNLSFCYIDHSDLVKSWAIKINNQHHLIAYSGDGNFNSGSKKFYQSVDFLIHDAFHLNKSLRHHADIEHVLKMAKECKVKKLALVHINKDVRREKAEEIKRIINKSVVKVFVPDDGDSLVV